MRFIKRSQRVRPELSLILLDWSVRESFHILHYLSRQSVDRELFEVIVVEYYSRVSDAVQNYADQVDTWLLLEVPEATYYHKHVMYNAGIIASRGKIIVISDSDAMVRENFVARILEEFRRRPEIVLHLDQFRNNRRDLYPFRFPSFEEVVGDGCINYVDGKTVGVCDTEDPLHSRNYGACMCATRNDLITIGGADEHIDYLGHICGPYELTFRLVNYGRKEVWLDDQFTYHTWHPGQAGEKDYIGPHDGRHVSARALEARLTGRITPLVENSAIQLLRLRNATAPLEQLLADLMPPERLRSWSAENVAKLKPRLRRTLFSCGRPRAILRLSRTFVKLFVRQAIHKAVQLHESSNASPGLPRAASAVSPRALSLRRAYDFAKRTLDFCIYATERSRACLAALAAEGNREISFYGCDGIADILYDLTFEIPVAVKNVYDDSGGKRFHAFKVLPVDSCGSAKEKLIITSLVGVEKKVARLKRAGVSEDRIIVLQ